MTHEARLIAGRYEVENLVGRGGMSDVHSGVDTRLGRRVAIKLLKPSLATDPTFRTRFRQEAQAAARMTHPTIVRVFDAGEETIHNEKGEEEKLPFIVMEYVDGVLLKDLIARGPLDVTESLHIARGILTALEYSHRAGVVHRDIKPGNVMITGSGQVKVMDFGIARAISDSSATMAQTTAVIGTASYFSPEQAKGESVDSRSDLYSTGVVLFEMLTGQAPFSGETAVSVAYQHVNSVPVTPSSLNSTVPYGLDVVVARALNKDRSERYQSADEFRADLDTVAAGRVPHHRTPEPSEESESPFADIESAFLQLAESQSAPKKRTGSATPWIWVGVVLVAIVVAGILFMTLRSGPDSATPTSVTVPKLAGLTMSQAKTQLNTLNLTWNQASESSSQFSSGTVTRTDPAAGTSVSSGSTITVYVSSGQAAVTVPAIQNMTVAAATAALKAVGLTVGATTSANSATVGANVVISSVPASGETATAGQSVALTVSTGNVTLPALVGQSISAASGILQQLGLAANPTPDTTCPQDTGAPLVHSQSVAPGDVPQGTTVTLTYCAG